MLLEAVVAEVLDKVLGAYVKGFDARKLKLSVWDGDIRLTRLELKPDAIEALGLPVRVLGGMIGEVRVSVPWRNLGDEPLVLTLDRLHVLVGAKDGSRWDEREEADAASRTKSEALEAWEALQDQQHEAAEPSMVERIVEGLLRRLEVHATKSGF